MKETPIIFSTPMVKAILESHKNQTRRVVKIKSGDYFATNKIIAGEVAADTRNYYGFCSENEDYPCPYGRVGDLLWVRETWAVDPYANRPGHRKILFKTDMIDPDYPIKWKPSIHMFKKYARIWLEITDIRVERLQDIRTGDILKEGTPRVSKSNDPWEAIFEDFEKLWDSINGKKHPWKSNPWVWAIEFKRVEKPQ